MLNFGNRPDIFGQDCRSDYFSSASELLNKREWDNLYIRRVKQKTKVKVETLKKETPEY